MRHSCRAWFTLNGFCPAPSAKHVNHSQYVFEAIIVTGIGLHVHKIGLPLVVDTTRDIVTRRITLHRWLVESMTIALSTSLLLLQGLDHLRAQARIHPHKQEGARGCNIFVLVSNRS